MNFSLQLRSYNNLSYIIKYFGFQIDPKFIENLSKSIWLILIKF